MNQIDTLYEMIHSRLREKIQNDLKAAYGEDWRDAVDHHELNDRVDRELASFADFMLKLYYNGRMP